MKQTAAIDPLRFGGGQQQQQTPAPRPSIAQTPNVTLPPPLIPDSLKTIITAIESNPNESIDFVYKLIGGEYGASSEQLRFIAPLIGKLARTRPSDFLTLAVIYPDWRQEILSNLKGTRVSVVDILNRFYAYYIILYLRDNTKDVRTQISRLASILIEVSDMSEARNTLQSVNSILQELTPRVVDFYKNLSDFTITRFLLDPILQNALFSLNPNDLVNAIATKGDPSWTFLVFEAIATQTIGVNTLSQISKSSDIRNAMLVMRVDMIDSLFKYLVPDSIAAVDSLESLDLSTASGLRLTHIIYRAFGSENFRVLLDYVQNPNQRYALLNWIK